MKPSKKSEDNNRQSTAPETSKDSSDTSPVGLDVQNGLQITKLNNIFEVYQSKEDETDEHDENSKVAKSLVNHNQYNHFNFHNQSNFV